MRNFSWVIVANNKVKNPTNSAGISSFVAETATYYIKLIQSVKVKKSYKIKNFELLILYLAKMSHVENFIKYL